MNTETILRLLHNSGFQRVSMDSEFVYMEDPSCILRSFETFLEYVWVAVALIAAFLLSGWAISLVRGAKYDNLFVNLRNLMFLFCGLTLVPAIVNFVYGDDIFARGCDMIKISTDKVNELINLRKEKLSDFSQFGIFENIQIYDSGAQNNSNDTVSESVSDIAPESNQTDTNETTEAPINVADVPVSASADGNDVIYSLPNGQRVKKVGGTRAWRNSNPGNIRYGKFAQRVGAIGQAGGFAVFPDEATGMYAIEALLRTDRYNKLSIKEAISHYAPEHENDTAAYQRRLSQLTGLSIDRPMSSLSASELTKVARAIRTIEGWKPGQTQRI